MPGYTASHPHSVISNIKIGTLLNIDGYIRQLISQYLLISKRLLSAFYSHTFSISVSANQRTNICHSFNWEWRLFVCLWNEYLALKIVLNIIIIAIAVREKSIDSSCEFHLDYVHSINVKRLRCLDHMLIAPPFCMCFWNLPNVRVLWFKSPTALP